jgi:Flp pilus assembly protein TadG
MRQAFGKVRATLARFGRARDGVAAVELALVAMPFILMTVGLGEISMIGFTQANLNYAVSETARGIRVGQVQTDGTNYAQIRATLCANLNRLMSLDCGNLYLDVKKYDSFVDVANPNPVQNGQFSDEGFGFDPGKPSDVVVVRAFYRWNLLTPLFDTIFGNIGTGERIMVSTMMFRNEPFPDPHPDD